jgi:flagellar biosynthesis protein FlhG
MMHDEALGQGQVMSGPGHAAGTGLTLVPQVRTGRMLAVASGKGGVGKTWFSITLAHAMARTGRRVLLFDGDLGLANVDIQLGLLPDRDVGAVSSGRLSLAEAAQPYEPGGFDIVAGRSGSGALSMLDAASLERVLAGLRTACGQYDAIVLDLGAGVDRHVRRMAAGSDTLLVLATEEPTSLTDAYALLKLHASDRPDADTRVVVNMASTKAAGERTYATLERACQTFLGRAPLLAGVIRRDDRVRDAIRRQTLLLLRHPTCLAASDVEQVVEAVLRPTG